jgi:membrane-bound lytic murein transglycosylase D
MKLKNILTVISILLLLAGCQSLPSGPVAEAGTSAQQAEPQSASEPLFNRAPVASALEKPPVDLWDRIRRELSWQSIHNAQVGKARDHYLRQSNYLPMVAGRGNYYLYYIVEEVENVLRGVALTHQ